MANVNMRDPNGRPYSVDASEMREAIANGWTVDAAPSDVSKSPVQRSIASAQASSQDYGPQNRAMLLNALPGAASTGFGLAASAVPGPGWLARPAMMGLGGMVGRFLANRLAGPMGVPQGSEMPASPQDLQGEGMRDAMGGLLFGELPVGAMKSVGKSMMRGSLNASRTIQDQAMEAASRRAGGAFIPPGEAGPWNQALEQNIPVGKGPPGMWGGAGSVRLNKLMDTMREPRDLSLRQAGDAGHAFNVMAATRNLGQLRNEISGLADSQGANEQLDNLVSGLVNEYREQGAGNKIGKLKLLSPDELNTAKEKWQAAARAIYKNPNAPPDQLLKARFYQNIAASARNALEGIPRFGETIARQNAQIEPLHNLMDAVVDAEQVNPGPHGYIGGATGTALRAMFPPSVISRLGLMLGGRDAALYAPQLLARLASVAGPQAVGLGAVRPPLAPSQLEQMLQAQFQPASQDVTR